MSPLKSFAVGGLPACFFVALSALPAAAQDRQKHLTLQGIASATVAPSGLAFFHVGGTPGNQDGNLDGSITLGFGFGDAQESIGGQLSANIVSLTDDFADSGHFALKLSRALNQSTYVGLQVERLGAWGDAGDIDVNARLAVTWLGAVPFGSDSYPVMVTVGAGNGVRNGESGVFGGVGVGFSEHFAASLAYTGNWVDLGIGIKVNELIQLSASVQDVFGQKDRQEIVLSATYTFNLFGK